MVLTNPFRRAFTTNATSSSFTAKVPTATQPSGTGVVDVLDPALGMSSSNQTPAYALLIPFGGAAENLTFDLRLWGWNRITDIQSGTAQTDDFLWIPQLLLELNVTTGNLLLVTGNYLADTLNWAKGVDDYGIVSPGNDLMASISCHIRGCRLLEFDVDMTGAASGNCLYRLFGEI